MTYTHRIRRCKGNTSAWCLVALRSDGTELEVSGARKTALSIDDLLRHAEGLRPSSNDVVQIIYDAGDA